MQIHIIRRPVTKGEVVLQVSTHGYAALASARLEQRKVAGEARDELVALGRRVELRELGSRSSPICLVDTDWQDLATMLAAVQAKDDRDCRE